MGLSAWALFAQADRATVSGTITDASGAVVADARIELKQTNTGFVREARTNNNGIYQVPGLPVGAYLLTVEKAGFATARVESLDLDVGQRATVNVKLEVSTTSNQVTVIAEAVELDKSTAEIASVISGADLKNIPLNGRNWASFMMLAPGAVNTGEGNQNSIRFFGRSRDENNFTFDGVDASGVKDPRQEANLRLNISMDAIAEFRVQSALYTAETGNGAGAQMNLVSKSGTNQFHGGLFHFFRNDKLDARRPIDAGRPPFRLNQFGGNIGGPIKRDRTFFFANFEGLQQRLAQTLIGFVPSAAFKQRAVSTSPAVRPVMDAYRPGTARTADPNIDQINSVASQPWKENSGLIKVDHRLTQKLNLAVRYNINDGIIDELRNALLETRTSFFRTQNGVIQLQQTWSPTLFNETKIGVNRSALNRFTNGTFNEGVQIPGFVSLQVDRHEVEVGTSYSLLNNLSWIKGRHTFKFGGEIRKIDLVFADSGSVNTVFQTRDNFILNRVDSVSVAGSVPSTKVLRPYYFGYLQDEWKATRNLTLSLGARYEYYSVSKAANGAGRVLDLQRCGGFCAPGTQWYFPDRNNWAPRVGLAWSPDLFKGKTVFRMGYGLFYGPGQLDDVNAALDSIPENRSLSIRDVPTLAFPAVGFINQARGQGASPRSLQRDRRDGYSQQWTFSIQQQLPWSFVGQAAYVGSNAHHQFNRTFINVLGPDGRRPFPAFSNIDEKQNFGNSNFNGLQMSLNRPFKNGLLWQTQYMWSRNISDNAGAGDGSQAMISLCRRCDRADADWDVRHTMTNTWAYQLPFGKGGKYGPRDGFAAHLIGGWNLSGMWVARTGRPYNVTVNRSAADLPDGVASTPSASAPPQRPDFVPGAPLYPSVQTPDAWANVGAFRVPARGTWGNLGRNALRAPGMWQVDLGLGKQQRLTERVGLEFRAEMFNLFNRAQYGIPNANISNPAQFGRITSVINAQPTGSGGPRQVQLMLRLNF